MTGDVEARIRPDLVRRTCGGWLAVSPSWARFKIGVTADTEEDAREKFAAHYRRWGEILELATPGTGSESAPGRAQYETSAPARELSADRSPT